MSSTYKNGHALVIGVGQDLPNTVNDAKGLAAILTDPSRCAYPPEQVTLLVNEKADRLQVLEALDKLAKTTNSESTVVIYFSGHGYQVASPTGEFYYLMPYGYSINKLYQTAISGQEFAEKLRAITSQKLLILLDCCHAGGVGEAKVPGLEIAASPLPPEAIKLLQEGRGKALIASCQEDQLSYIYKHKQYSEFTLALMEAFCGSGVAKKDGSVRVADLALHTRQVIPTRTQDRQHPVLHFEKADNFVVGYYAGGSIEPKGLPFPQATEEAEMETAAKSQPSVVFYQKDQTVDNQTNIAGNVGEIGKQETHISGGFNQPGWKVSGDVIQSQRDVIIGAKKRLTNDSEDE